MIFANFMLHFEFNIKMVKWPNFSLFAVHFWNCLYVFLHNVCCIQLLVASIRCILKSGDGLKHGHDRRSKGQGHFSSLRCDRRLGFSPPFEIWLHFVMQKKQPHFIVYSACIFFALAATFYIKTTFCCRMLPHFIAYSGHILSHTVATFCRIQWSYFVTDSRPILKKNSSIFALSSCI